MKSICLIILGVILLLLECPPSELTPIETAEKYFKMRKPVAYLGFK